MGFPEAFRESRQKKYKNASNHLNICVDAASVVKSVRVLSTLMVVLIATEM